MCFKNIFYFRTKEDTSLVPTGLLLLSVSLLLQPPRSTGGGKSRFPEPALRTNRLGDRGSWSERGRDRLMRPQHRGTFPTGLKVGTFPPGHTGSVFLTFCCPGSPGQPPCLWTSGAICWVISASFSLWPWLTGGDRCGHCA